MTAMLLVQLFLMPACATAAGTVLWLLYRSETLDDASLVRNFSFFLIVIALAGFGILRTDSMRMKIDPAFRIQTEIESDALYSTIAKISPDDASRLRNVLQAHLSAGASFADAMLSAYPWLWNEVRRRTGWVDQSTKLEWASYITSLLNHARTERDHELCFAIITKQNLSEATFTQSFSAQERQQFLELAIRIYEQSDLGMRRELNSPDTRVDFNTAAREYAVISDEMEQRFGDAVVQLLRSDRIGSAPPSSYETLCTARIFQLEAMQARPKAMAARLVDSVVR